MIAALFAIACVAVILFAQWAIKRDEQQRRDDYLNSKEHLDYMRREEERKKNR